MKEGISACRFSLALRLCSFVGFPAFHSSETSQLHIIYRRMYVPLLLALCPAGVHASWGSHRQARLPRQESGVDARVKQPLARVRVALDRAEHDTLAP